MSVRRVMAVKEGQMLLVMIIELEINSGGVGASNGAEGMVP